MSDNAHRVRKVLLAVDVRGRWTQERQEVKAAAIESGTTSIRVSHRTAAGLRQVARELGAIGGWYYLDSVPLSELLEWLACGVVIRPDRRLTRACIRAIARKHAKVDGSKSAAEISTAETSRPKSMQSLRPRQMHAGGDR